jgi:hypothetical protein
LVEKQPFRQNDKENALAVMMLLAAAHIGFWSWGTALAMQVGSIGLAGTVALGLWLAAIGLWLAYVARLSLSGWLTGPGVAALPWLWVPLPPVMLTMLGLLLVPVLRDAWLAVLLVLPVIAVPALHALRILAIGTVIKASHVQFPRRIGFAVGIPDTLFGLWSGFIALSGGFQSERHELVWNLTGLAILLMMIPMVFTLLRQPRLDAPGRGPARAILVFPMVLAPAGLATLFAVVHVLSLFRILV